MDDATKNNYRLGVGVQRTPAAISRGSKEVRGVLIRSVMYNSPAARAGLRPGDLILSVDDVDVGTPQFLHTYIEHQPSPAELVLAVLRAGHELRVLIQLDPVTRW